MRKFIALLLVLTMAVGMSACAEVDSNPQSSDGAITTINDDTTMVEEDTEASTEPIKTQYCVGDTLQDGSLKIVFMSSGEYKEENEFMQPEEGKKYIFLTFYFENTGKSDASISSFDFDCFADGYAVEPYFGGDEDLSATLSAGRHTVGSVYFTVPVDASEIEVEYTTNVFTSDKIKFLYEGDKNSGFAPDAEVSASTEAHNVGDKIESKQMNISYLACTEYQSDNDFIQPKEGNRFVSCEFEFENTGESDTFVSSMDFDCFADGTACEQTYIGEQLSATLSAGRKTKGIVIFEVPVDATVVEVEYVSNYWTSDRLVFNAIPQ